MNTPLASRTASWNASAQPSALAKTSATQGYSGGSSSQGSPATCGTSQSPPSCIWCVISIVITSKVFQGSCPARPGTTKTSAISASTAKEGGSASLRIMQLF
jgi:hypothetical protein